METIKLKNKKTGFVGEYNIYLGNTPQSIVVELDGVGVGYFSLQEIADRYEIVLEDKGN